jgi:uncharacterized membrane-anchored protein YjiN (DUF445 family)
MSRRDPHSIPRVTIHKGGRATLSGLDYRDLRDIFTSAALHAYDAIEKAKANKKLKNAERAEEIACFRQELQLLDALDKAVLGAIDHANARAFPRPWRKPTKAERLAAVTAERKERVLLDDIINSMKTRHITNKGA